jgi:hypothetical protein
LSSQKHNNACNIQCSHHLIDFVVNDERQQYSAIASQHNLSDYTGK